MVGGRPRCQLKPGHFGNLYGAIQQSGEHLAKTSYCPGKTTTNNGLDFVPIRIPAIL